ncbi:DUF6233 domain-containing protein (plasmid) [Streptomyces sp. BI20]|uniref:DUF6233 domain-containing protein n=1 Tax=Streptomyces sp. BI20 TaxID=3403460 RepID=UPI003C71792F
MTGIPGPGALGDILPPDLDRLRTIETWTTVLLDAVRARIAELEAAAGPRTTDTTGTVRSRPTPPPPEWIIELGIDALSRPILVHAGDCTMPGRRRRPATRAQALDVLRDPSVDACGICGAARLLGTT